MAKFTYLVVIAPHLTAVSFVAMPSARKIYLKNYQKQFLEVPYIGDFDRVRVKENCLDILTKELRAPLKTYEKRYNRLKIS